MIRIINGDLFSTAAPIIAHQVNCQGKMGSGVALQVKKLYPEAYSQYIILCHNPIHGRLLGTAPGCMCQEKIIYNLFGQKSYGYDGEKYTDIHALKNAMIQLADYAQRENQMIAMPYRIGCGRGALTGINMCFQ